LRRSPNLHRLFLQEPQLLLVSEEMTPIRLESLQLSRVIGEAY
jgi:hypothetical protein